MNKAGESSSSGDTTKSPAVFHPALLRKLITMHLEGSGENIDGTSSSNLAVLTGEAAEVLGELLKMFVLEARNRASLEAEVEQEVLQTNNDKDDDNDGTTIYVRSDHCSKIATEMLLDFS